MSGIPNVYTDPPQRGYNALRFLLQQLAIQVSPYKEVGPHRDQYLPRLLERIDDLIEPLLLLAQTPRQGQPEPAHPRLPAFEQLVKGLQALDRTAAKTKFSDAASQQAFEQGLQATRDQMLEDYRTALAAESFDDQDADGTPADFREAFKRAQAR